MKNSKVYKIVIYSFMFSTCFMTGGKSVFAQSNLKEGNNQYALYSKSGDRKLLEASRKYADDAYKTRRDTISFRNNLLRALVYSTLAVVDSNRTLKYTEDPLVISHRSLNKLTDKQLSFENEPEINHIIRNLANGHLIMGNKALHKKDYEQAYRQFRIVDSLESKTYNMRDNLAFLSHQLGMTDEAIVRYEALTNTQRTSKPAYIHSLADLYEINKRKNQLINTLERGHEQFPESTSILFRLINTLKDDQAYDKIVLLLDKAFKLAPKNIDLYYIAAYTYEMTGDPEKAKYCYEQMISLDKNSYYGNFGVGLLYLDEYIKNPKNNRLQTKAQEYLLKANQINPTGINALKSLAVFYQANGDLIQLERVNNILDQLTLN